MKKQNPLNVFLLSLFTFGIYGIVWLARTRGEMVRRGAEIPTTFLIILPFINLYYLWKWSQGVEHVTNGKMQWFIAFLLQWVLGSIGSAIIQDSFNTVGESTVAAPVSASAATMATPSVEGPTQQATTAAPTSTQSPPAPTQPPTNPPTQLVQ